MLAHLGWSSPFRVPAKKSDSRSDPTRSHGWVFKKEMVEIQGATESRSELSSPSKAKPFSL